MRRVFALLACAALLSSGCVYAQTKASRAEEYYQLYFSVGELTAAGGGDAIAAEPSALRRDGAERPQAAMEHLLAELLAGPEDPALKSPIPAGTQLMSASITGSRALVDLTSAYSTLSGVSLTLADYCIALTLTQVPEIRAVSVTVRGQELVYRESQTFSARDVLLSSTEDVVGSMTATLYFINPAGVLAGQERTLELYEGDTQAEALVEALGNGPAEKGWTSALPEGFGVQSVWLEEDTCYVNLLASALEPLPEDANLQLAIRALTGSLLSLESVTEVRVLVDGQSADRYGGADISRPFSKG